MQPLFDGDIFLYEIGYAAKTGWNTEGEEPPWWYVQDMLDTRIQNICAVVQATEPALFFLTGNTNFRTDIAKKQKYKDRPGDKPWHYANLKAYLLGVYGAIIHEGLEADDLLALAQVKALREGRETIICSRDKDLRAVPGWHYGWEIGKQPEFGPEFVEGIGWIELESKVGGGAKPVTKHTIRGVGMKFFYAQCLTGDTVDSIPGLPKCGPIAAFKLLDACQTTHECFMAVLEAYCAVYGDFAEEELLEQGRLLHMTRELHEDGSPILWELPYANQP